MASTQKVSIEERPTWTVLDAGYSTAGPVEGYLEFLRSSDYAANTVKSYARALALWWTFLEGRGSDWKEVQLKDFGTFMQSVRAGLVENGATPLRDQAAVSDATVAARVRAVMSFYRYHSANGVTVASSLYEQVRSPNSKYLPFLEHVARRHGRTRSRVRVRVPRAEAPVLLPSQIQGVLDHEARWDPQSSSWLGDVRYRLLWSVLAETGARLGEALSLRHGDWVTSRGGIPYVHFRPSDHPHGMSLKSGARRVHVSTRLDRLYGDYVWALCERGADSVVRDWDGSYIFVNLKREPMYAPMRPESVYDHLRILKRKRLFPPAMTPHWLRHTHATALLLAEVPPHVVSRRLGHADVQTTLNTYGHVTQDAELAALADWQDFTKGWAIT